MSYQVVCLFPSFENYETNSYKYPSFHIRVDINFQLMAKLPEACFQGCPVKIQ